MPLLIPKERKGCIIRIAKDIKSNYLDMTEDSVIDVAKRYGRVKNVIKTPLVRQSCLVSDKHGDSYIFYRSVLPGVGKFNIAHETGHAILHHDEAEGQRGIVKGL